MIGKPRGRRLWTVAAAVLAFGFALPGSSRAAASTYHVAVGGSDSAAGTAARPWRTIQHAEDHVPAGAVVVIHPGAYKGFVIHLSGLAGRPTVFRGVHGAARPVISGSGDGGTDVIRVNGVHDIQLRHLDITGAPGGDYRGAGVRTENGATRIEIVDSDIHANRSYGVNVSGSTDVTIRGNDISHNEVGVQVGGGGEGTLISHNRIHHNDLMTVNTSAPGDDAGAVGIAFNKSSGHVTASGNRVWGNRARSHDYGWDGSAFEIYGASNVTISGNTAWDNENVLETGMDAGGQCASNRFVRNSVHAETTAGDSWGMFLRCATDMLVASNTFVGLEQFVFSIGYDSPRYNGSLKGLHIEDNLVDVSATGAKAFGFTTAPADLGAGIVIDHDLLRTAPGAHLMTLPGTGNFANDLATLRQLTPYEDHGVTGDPRFVDSAAHDYHLKADSPAIDAGVAVAGVSDTWKGAAPDIGRFESTP